MLTYGIPLLIAGLCISPLAIGDPYFVYPDVFNDPERDAFYYGTFPEDFQWSTATSAYQIEGGWDADDKGVQIWDTFSHIPGNIANGDTGDVACDSYNNYETDVELIAAMGLKYYRFSLSWSRLLPNGTVDEPSDAGLQYYNNLIDKLLENGITPQVTLYHWDLPQAIEDNGGFLNDSFPDLFNEYAIYCFEKFGDRVKFWITFNEPWVITILGYGEGRFAPGIYGWEDERVYVSGHNLLLAHGLAYHSYDKHFRESQKGQIGITLNCDFFEPFDRTDTKSVEAADRAHQFMVGWFASPIFKTGDYPPIMREKVDSKSEAAGLEDSRLPSFTEDQKTMLLHSSDFFGLSHYITLYAKDTGNVDNSPPVNYYKDSDVITWQDDSWPTSGSPWLRPVPWGLRRLLKWLKNEYGSDIPIYITENGVSTPDVSSLDDTTRVQFYRGYINEVLKAVRIDDVNVKCYTAWSLMDNFGWTSGYTERYGLHYVNFTDPGRPRTAKSSADEYAKIVANNGFLEPPTNPAPENTLINVSTTDVGTRPQSSISSLTPETTEILKSNPTPETTERRKSNPTPEATESPKSTTDSGDRALSTAFVILICFLCSFSLI